MSSRKRKPSPQASVPDDVNKRQRLDDDDDDDKKAPLVVADPPDSPQSELSSPSPAAPVFAFRPVVKPVAFQPTRFDNSVHQVGLAMLRYAELLLCPTLLYLIHDVNRSQVQGLPAVQHFTPASAPLQWDAATISATRQYLWNKRQGFPSSLPFAQQQQAWRKPVDPRRPAPDPYLLRMQWAANEVMGALVDWYWHARLVRNMAMSSTLDLWRRLFRRSRPLFVDLAPRQTFSLFENPLPPMNLTTGAAAAPTQPPDEDEELQYLGDLWMLAILTAKMVANTFRTRHFDLGCAPLPHLRNVFDAGAGTVYDTTASPLFAVLPQLSGGPAVERAASTEQAIFRTNNGKYVIDGFQDAINNAHSLLPPKSLPGARKVAPTVLDNAQMVHIEADVDQFERNMAAARSARASAPPAASAAAGQDFKVNGMATLWKPQNAQDARYVDLGRRFVRMAEAFYCPWLRSRVRKQLDPPPAPPRHPPPPPSAAGSVGGPPADSMRGFRQWFLSKWGPDTYLHAQDYLNAHSDFRGLLEDNTPDSKSKEVTEFRHMYVAMSTLDDAIMSQMVQWYLEARHAHHLPLPPSPMKEWQRQVNSKTLHQGPLSGKSVLASPTANVITDLWVLALAVVWYVIIWQNDLQNDGDRFCAAEVGLDEFFDPGLHFLGELGVPQLYDSEDTQQFARSSVAATVAELTADKPRSSQAANQPGPRQAAMQSVAFKLFDPATNPAELPWYA